MLNYRLVGDGKQTLVFLHGWSGSIDSFLSSAYKLHSKYKCLLLDFYGFGKSVFPHEKPLYVEDYVFAVRELLEILNIKAPIVIGHSFGGRVAIKLASQIKLKAIVLADSAGILPRRGLKYYLKVSSYKLRKKLNLDIKNCGSIDYQELNKTEKETFKNIVNEDLSMDAKKIDVPALLIWGDKDKDTPLYMAKKLNKLIKNSALIIFKNCGHFAYLENNIGFIKIIDSFARSLNNSI